MAFDDQSGSGAERDSLLKRIEELGSFISGGWKKPLAPLDLAGGVRWTPDYVKDGAVLAIVMGADLPAFLKKRLVAAHDSGLKILCVVDWAGLTSDEVIVFLGEIGAEISLSSDGGFTEPQALLKFLGVHEIGISEDARRKLIECGLAACMEAPTKSLKGKTLEWLLHFMFSQVKDFTVKACNYRTDTEELDVVIQLTALDHKRCWAHMNAPLLIAEAKNWAAKVGQEVVSKVNTVISVKRGACKIGFVVSLGGFTSDAREQVLKLASVERIFVLMDRPLLERWAFAADYDAELNDIVLGAILK